MRKLIYYVATSLDGYIARPDGGLDWLYTEGNFGYEAFIETIDTVIFGRKTWDQVLAFGPWHFGERRGVVFSRSVDRVPDGYPVDLTRGDVASFLRDVRAQPGKDIWLVGGGELFAQFADAGLVDEIIISIHPVLLGAGLPVSGVLRADRWFSLQGVSHMEKDLLQLRYVRGTPPLQKSS